MKAFNGPNTEEVLDLESDAQDNTYSCGHFSGLSTFGSYSITATNLSDGFVCKQDPAGTPLWVIKLGGSGFDRVVSIAVKPSGNIIATGVFDGNASFGSFQLSSQSNTQDIFVVEIQPDGTVLWARSFAGSGQDIVSGLCVDASGKTFLSAQFRGNISVGNENYTSALNDTTHLPSYDILFIRLDGNGQVDWSLQGADNYDSRGLKAVTDANGNYYVLIEYSDTLLFQNQSLLPGGVNGNALIKLNNTGKLDWTRRILAAKSEPNDITLKGDKVYVAGNFSGSLHFPDNSGTNITANYTNQYFVAPFNLDGTLMQQITGGSDNFMRLTAIAVDNDNAVYIGGNFGCSFTELSTLYGDGVFNSVGYQDIWYGKVNASGQKLWFQQYGGRGQDELWDMGIRDIDRPVLCGSFERKLSIPAGSETGQPNAGSLYNAYNQPSAYCSTSSYQIYRQISALGNKDGFVIDWHSTGRAPYDYYWRDGGLSTCNRIQIPSFISPNIDTILSCQGTPNAINRTVEYSRINSSSGTVRGPDREQGPEFRYFWNGVEGNATATGLTNYTGNVYLETRTKDDCFSFKDTAYFSNIPVGNIFMTSRKYEILQLSSTDPGDCPFILILPNNSKDTLEASIDNPLFEYHWQLPNGEIKHGKTLEITSPGLYKVSAEFGDSMCLRSRCLQVIGIAFDSISGAILNGSIVPILDIPGLKNDTLYICNNKDIAVSLVDSLTMHRLDIPLIGEWSSTGLVDMEPGVTFIKHVKRYRDSSTGWNTVTLDLYIPGTIKQYLLHITKRFYTVVGSSSITTGYTLTPSEPTFCSGKTVKISINGPKPFSRLSLATVSNPTVTITLNVDPYASFFLATEPGTYRITKDSIDTITGCSHVVNGTLILQLRKAPQIIINPANGYLCPNDSILLTGAPGTDHIWYGPTGAGLPGNQTVFAHAPGNYAYAYTDSLDCRLTSGTIVINEYRVPPLSAESDHVCPGDSIKISIITYSGLQYVWNNPAGVIKPFIYAKTPGYYSASYTFCGLTQTNGVQINGSTEKTGIVADKDKFCEGEGVWLRAKYPGWSNVWLPSESDSSAIYVVEDGAVTLRSVDPSGCTTQSILPIDFRPTPASPELINPGGAYCAGTLAQLNASGTGIIWLINQDTLSGNSIQFSIPADTLHFFLKSIDPISGCEGITDTFEIIGRPTIQKEFILGDTLVCASEDIILYPSGNQGYIHRTWGLPGGISLEIDSLFIPAGSLQDLDKIFLITGPDSSWCGIQQDSTTLNILPAAIITGIPDSVISCAGNSLVLFPETIDQAAQYSWSGPPLLHTNGPNLTVNPLNVANQGEFTLRAQLENCITTRHVYLVVNPIPSPAILSFSGKFCLNDSIEVTAQMPDGGAQYFWIFAGDTLYSVVLPISVQAALLNQQGWFSYSLKNCPAEPIHFEISQIYTVNSSLPDTLFRCKDDQITLGLSASEIWSQIEWSTGETSQTINSPATEGPIYVKAYTQEGCGLNDSIYVKVYPCNTIPENVFSPDGDGINDLFLFPGEGVTKQTVTIFNRWGSLIWQSSGTSMAWNGKTKTGDVLPEGTYFYLVDIEYINGSIQELKGNIALFH